MKYDMTLCILQLIILSVFFVKHSFENITEACLNEIIKTNIMLKSITVKPDENADNNWNEKIKEHELIRYDFDFKTLIPTEDKIEEITEQLMKGCQDKSGVFYKSLILTEKENSPGRLQKELKIQKVLCDVLGFKENQIKRIYKDILQKELKERKKTYKVEWRNRQEGQNIADKDVLNSAVAERITVLYNYINKAVEKKKKIQMCKSDSMKCILLGLQTTLDALPKLCNYTAKCEGDVCQINLIQGGGKKMYSNYIDKLNYDADEYKPTKLTKDEAVKLEQTEGEGTSEETEDEAGTSKQKEDEDD